MAKTEKDARPTPRLPKGLRDIEAAELRQQQDMLGKIRAVYERYGFEPLETPAFEYTDALGKFLPDQDRPNEGVFSFQDVASETRGEKDSGEWVSLRYDLTAPLARYVAQNYQDMPKPFRRYAVGQRCGATRSRGRAASASSCSSTPIRSGPRASPPTPRCACSPPTRWKRSASSAATT